MITRIFRVKVPKALHAEFEQQFLTISVLSVQSQNGCVSVSVGKPTIWQPEEYVMITEWLSVEALEQFAGKEWNQAVIPSGMEKYVLECWTHHYENLDS
ncbi:MAG: antibiotic biosynthesis monooxygenase [Snowella sp.]|nr:antibiotic biosynthesis monooxygenase [Snowella sp.]